MSKGKLEKRWYFEFQIRTASWTCKHTEGWSSGSREAIFKERRVGISFLKISVGLILLGTDRVQYPYGQASDELIVGLLLSTIAGASKK